MRNFTSSLGITYNIYSKPPLGALNRQMKNTSGSGIITETFYGSSYTRPMNYIRSVDFGRFTSPIVSCFRFLRWKHLHAVCLWGERYL